MGKSRFSKSTVASLVQTNGRGKWIRVRLSNAYDSPRSVLQDVTFRFLAAPQGSNSIHPAGKVGLVFANVDQLPELVHDMFVNHAHYRATARAFAESWRSRHDANRIVRAMQEATGPARRAVA